MSTPENIDRDALRQEIQAAIKAGRDLDPTMDEHLADSALDRYSQEHAARSAKVAPPRPAAPVVAGPNPNLEYITRTLLFVVAIGGVIAMFVFKWWYFPWWLIFPLFWWGRGWSRGSRRYGYYGGGYQALSPEDDELRRREKETRRRLKIQQMETEIQRLKSGIDDE
jgi:hypothetical protein